MRRVEGKLATWHQLHRLAEDARLRRDAAGDGPARQVLDEEVRRLTRDADAAIAEVHAALATARKSPRADAQDGQRKG